MEILNTVKMIAGTNLPDLCFMNDEGKTIIQLWLSRGHGETLRHDAHYVKTGKEVWSECIRLDELIKPDPVTGEMEVDEFYFRCVMSLIYMNLQEKFDLHFNVSLDSGEEWVKNSITLLNNWWRSGRK